MQTTAVSERLGHSSVRVTADIYSHAIRGRNDEAARRWEELQRQPVQEYRRCFIPAERARRTPC